MRLIIGVLFGVAVTLAASVTQATIIDGTVTGGNSGGVFQKISPPLANPFGLANSVGNDTFQSANLFGFDEGQNILITVILAVDDLADGLGGGTGPGVLPTGTVVASHYVFFDPATNRTIEGTVEFDSNVLALIFSSTNLDDSDFLINTGVNYLSPNLRGLEAVDDVSITDLRTIAVDFTASSPGDYLRVLTAFSPAAVPAPGALWLLLAGWGALALRRRVV